MSTTTTAVCAFCTHPDEPTCPNGKKHVMLATDARGVVTLTVTAPRCSVRLPDGKETFGFRYCGQPGELAEDLGAGFALCADHRPAGAHAVVTRKGTTVIWDGRVR